MEREKEIEEMAQDYDDIRTQSYRDYIPQSNMGIAYYFANALADKGYRKIPEGAMVLTKEEYDRLNKYIKAVDVYEMQMKNGEIDMTIGSDNAKLFISTLINLFRQNGAKNFFSTTVECSDNGEKYSLTIKKENGKSLAEATNEKVEQVRKETAREIIDEISKVLKDLILDDGVSGKEYLKTVRHFDKLKTRLREKYGVEVE